MRMAAVCLSGRGAKPRGATDTPPQASFLLEGRFGDRDLPGGAFFGRGDAVPGSHINDHQVRYYMKMRQTVSPRSAAACAAFSTATAYRLGAQQPSCGTQMFANSVDRKAQLRSDLLDLKVGVAQPQAFLLSLAELVEWSVAHEITARDATTVSLLRLRLGERTRFACRSFGCLDGVRQQHRDGHRPDTARHRRDVGDFARDSGEIDIADDRAIRKAVDANVDDDG